MVKTFTEHSSNIKIKLTASNWRMSKLLGNWNERLYILDINVYYIFSIAYLGFIEVSRELAGGDIEGANVYDDFSRKVVEFFQRKWQLKTKWKLHNSRTNGTPDTPYNAY